VGGSQSLRVTGWRHERSAAHGEEQGEGRHAERSSWQQRVKNEAPDECPYQSAVDPSCDGPDDAAHEDGMWCDAPDGVIEPERDLGERRDDRPDRGDEEAH